MGMMHEQLDDLPSIHLIKGLDNQILAVYQELIRQRHISELKIQYNIDRTMNSTIKGKIDGLTYSIRALEQIVDSIQEQDSKTKEAFDKNPMF